MYLYDSAFLETIVGIQFALSFQKVLYCRSVLFLKKPNKRNLLRTFRKVLRTDSSVGIALGYGLDGRGYRVLFPAGAGNFSLHHRVQNGSGAHPASYPMGIRGSFLVGKAAGT
jgi:hypothetical protein